MSSGRQRTLDRYAVELERRRSSISAPDPATLPPPSFDHLFYDSFPYNRQRRIAVQDRASRHFATEGWVRTAPPPFTMDWLFYDSYRYPQAKINAVRDRASRYQTTDNWMAYAAAVSGAAPLGPEWGIPPFGVVPFGGASVPPLDFLFADQFPYNPRNQYAAQIPRRPADQVIDPRFNFTPTVTTSGFAFLDGTPYSARALVAQILKRQSYIADASWWQTFISLPAMDWPFYDLHPYQQVKARQLGEDRSRRNWIADASWYQNFVVAVPNFGHRFYDSFPYANNARTKTALDRASRNWLAEGWIAFGAGFPPQSTDFLFNDAYPYRTMERLRQELRFNRNYLADFPAQANLVAPFVSPGGWLPTTNPIGQPVRPRLSYWVIGAPSDIVGNVVQLPAWNPLNTLPDQRWQRSKALERMVPPVAPVFPLPTPHFTPGFNPGNIVGAAFNVCTELRTLLAAKIISATVCQSIRSYTVPVNTSQICQTFFKDPQALLDFSIDWTAPLAVSGDTIATSSWTAAAGIAITASTYVGDITTVFLTGGVNQTSYVVTNTVTTAGGRTLAQDLVISVVLQ